MAKKNDTTQYTLSVSETQIQNNTLAIGIMQERFKNVESNLEELKTAQDKGFGEIKGLLGNGYVTKDQHENLAREVKDTSDLMKLVRNIVVTSIVVGLLILLGLKNI